MNDKDADKKPNKLQVFADKYAQMNWELVPVPYGKKAPTEKGWNAQALLDTVEKVNGYFSRNPISNVGLLHKWTVSVDIDHLKLFRKIMDDYGIDTHTLLKQGLEIRNGRENRAKAIFRIPADLAEKFQTKRAFSMKVDGKQTTIFELRLGIGCQDLIPPSLHPDTGKHYEWVDKAPWEVEEIPELPKEFVAMLKDWPSFTAQFEAILNPDSKLNDISNYAPSQDKRRTAGKTPSIINNFNERHDLRTMLTQHGYKQVSKNRYLAPMSSSGLAGLVVFEDDMHFYCHHASCPFGDGKRHDAFDIFVTFQCNGNFMLAKRSHSELIRAEREQSYAPLPPNKIADIAKKFDPYDGEYQEIGTDLAQRMPGIAGDIYRHIIETAPQPQPILAAQTALHVIASMAARRFYSRYNKRITSKTNFQSAMLGGTGSGKEHCRQYIDMALTAMGRASQLAGEDIASTAGVVNRCSLTPDAVFLIDEAHDFVAAVLGKKANEHKKNILSTITKLYSSTNKIVRGAEYADTRNQKHIHYPCINLILTAVPQQFFDVLTKDSVNNGVVNRFLMVESHAPRKLMLEDLDEEDDETPVHGLPDSIRMWGNAINQLVKDNTPPGALEIDPTNPIQIRYTKEAKLVMRDLELRVVEEIGKDQENMGLWVRVTENATKVATILGCGKKVPQIDVEDAQWAADWVLCWTRNTVIRSKDFSSSDREKAMNTIEQILRSADSPMTAREIFKRRKNLQVITGRERDELIEILILNDVINAILPDGHGSVRYCLHESR